MLELQDRSLTCALRGPLRAASLVDGFAGLLAGLFLACLPLTGLAQSLPARAAPAVELPQARPAMERQEIRAQLMLRRYTTLAAEIGARISRLPLTEGGSFTEGQLLVAFDCSLPQAQLDKADAELEAASQSYKANPSGRSTG